MAWDTRGNQRYGYESVRVDGCVRKEYTGGGLLGQFAEQSCKLARWEREKRRWDAEDEAGHRPQRGKWRR